MDVFIRHYDRTNHLVLFGCEKYAAIFDRIRYLIWLLVFSHNHAEIKNWFRWWMPLEKRFTLQIVVIIIKSAFNRSLNHYYYNIILKNIITI